MSLKDVDDADIAFLTDLLIDQANMQTESSKTQAKPKVRRATQADFDML